MGQSGRITSVAQCYAHALTIEHEAVARYREFADYLEERGNEATARLFRELAKFEAEHESVLEQRAKDMALPRLKAWQYSWLDDAPPESVDHNLVFHLMTPFDALKIAEGAERRAQTFFEQIAASAEDSEVRALARDMAREEAEHVKWISKQISRTPRPLADDAIVPSAFLG